jgi:hypothetical protein
MQTVKLRIHESVYNQLMWLLKRFSKNEIEVIKETDEFISVQEYLTEELKTIETGEAEFINLDQLNRELESTIKNHED